MWDHAERIRDHLLQAAEDLSCDKVLPNDQTAYRRALSGKLRQLASDVSQSIMYPRRKVGAAARLKFRLPK